MVMEGTALYRVAGVSAWVAVVAFIVSGITIGLFFGGFGQFWGPINDIATSITMFALILPLLAVDRMAGEQAMPWLRVVTVAAIAGALLIATGLILLVVGVIDLQTSFVTFGIGVVPVLVWMGALIVLALPMDVLPPIVGWTAALTLGLIGVAVATSLVTTGPLLWVAGFVVAAGFVLCWSSLAMSLLRSASAG
ncbi:MAG TPA: hypothetical protein VIF84_04545 [Candidatus Limnocylindrales bacterium]|jgi:hypothetical protein